MIIPNLDNVKALKCVRSHLSCWTKGVVYPVYENKIKHHELSRSFIEGADASMDFEVIYHDEKPENNQVKNPSHYDFYGQNSIENIACALTEAEWKGFCKGSSLKYRIRAGKKGDLQQDIDKANNFESLYEEHKHLCRS